MIDLKKRFSVKDLIEVVIIGSGLNYYKRIPWGSKQVTINEKSYNINTKKLFVVPRNIIIKFKDRLYRHRNVYRIVFREGSPEAVALPPLSRRDPSSDILYIAERSNALKKGLQELFSSTWVSRKILLFLFIAVGILAFAYLYATNQLPEISLPF
jgi:hypothetical protein